MSMQARISIAALEWAAQSPRGVRKMKCHCGRSVWIWEDDFRLGPFTALGVICDICRKEDGPWMTPHSAYGSE